MAQTFNGQVGYNRSVSATISRNGDLISNMFLEVVMTWNKGANDQEMWYPAESLISEISLEIGGQRIDRQTADWFRVYDELYRTEQQKKAYKDMTNFTEEEMQDGTDTDKPVGIKRRFYLPLLFWFCRDTSVSLPLIALQFREVKVNITFASASAAGTTTVGGKLVNSLTDDLECQLYVDYVFLDSAERKQFAQSNTEMLITQLQYTTETIDPMTANGSTKNVRLSFNHPCSTLIWFVRGAKHGWFNVSRALAPEGAADATPPESMYNDIYAPLRSAKLTINGLERASARVGKVYNRVIPYQTLGARPQAGLYIYSFALDAGAKVTQGCGTLNFSRIDNCTLSMDFKKVEDTNATAGFVADPDYMAGDKRKYDLRTLVIMALNFNVLRLVSGMAGLAFSN